MSGSSPLRRPEAINRGRDYREPGIGHSNVAEAGRAETVEAAAA